MEMPSLEEEATMREPFYGGEWDGDPDWYPADDDDNYSPNDIPPAVTYRIVSDELYDRLEDDDPVETDDPYDEDPSFYGDDYPSEPEDWRHGESAGDEGWSE